MNLRMEGQEKNCEQINWKKINRKKKKIDEVEGWADEIVREWEDRRKKRKNQKKRKKKIAEEEGHVRNI